MLRTTLLMLMTLSLFNNAYAGLLFEETSDFETTEQHINNLENPSLSPEEHETAKKEYDAFVEQTAQKEVEVTAQPQTPEEQQVAPVEAEVVVSEKKEDDDVYSDKEIEQAYDELFEHSLKVAHALKVVDNREKCLYSLSEDKLNAIINFIEVTKFIERNDSYDLDKVEEAYVCNVIAKKDAKASLDYDTKRDMKEFKEFYENKATKEYGELGPSWGLINK